MDVVIEKLSLERKNGLLALIKKSENVSEISISRTHLDKLTSFLSDKTMFLKMHEGQLFIQNIIAFGNVKIKDSRNRITTTINQRFNVGKSYVATTKKGIIETCRQFYEKIKMIKNEKKIIFDISKEVNLQREINTKVENGEIKDRVEVPVQKESAKVFVISRVLNFNGDKCQAINESQSLLLTTSVAAKEGLKAKFRKYIPQIQGNAELENVDAKKKVKTKNKGYIIPSILATIIIIGAGIITYNIVYNFIK